MIDLCALLDDFWASGLIKISHPILISANIRSKNRFKIIANLNVKNFRYTFIEVLKWAEPGSSLRFGQERWPKIVPG